MVKFSSQKKINKKNQVALFLLFKKRSTYNAYLKTYLIMIDNYVIFSIAFTITFINAVLTYVVCF
jgi:hypothetical protein